MTLQSTLAWSMRRAFPAGLALVVLAPMGCLDRFITKKETSLPPAAAAPSEAWGRLVTNWDSRVNFAPDSRHGGSPMPVLVGRCYLFGPELGVPHVGDGSMIVDLYDSTPRGDAEPKLIEELRIDPVSLKKCIQKDWIGQGYTIFFPWSTYRTDITHVYIIMRYDSADGRSLMHESPIMPVNHSEVQERIKRRMPITNPAMREPPALHGSAAPAPPAQQLPAPQPQPQPQLPTPQPAGTEMFIQPPP